MKCALIAYLVVSLGVLALRRGNRLETWSFLLWEAFLGWLVMAALNAYLVGVGASTALHLWWEGRTAEARRLVVVLSALAMLGAVAWGVALWP